MFPSLPRPSLPHSLSLLLIIYSWIIFSPQAGEGKYSVCYICLPSMCTYFPSSYFFLLLPFLSMHVLLSLPSRLVKCFYPCLISIPSSSLCISSLLPSSSSSPLLSSSPSLTLSFSPLHLPYQNSTIILPSGVG